MEPQNSKKKDGALILPLIMNGLNLVILAMYLGTHMLFLSLPAFLINCLLVWASWKVWREQGGGKNVAALLLSVLAALGSLAFVVLAVLILLAKLGLLFS